MKKYAIQASGNLAEALKQVIEASGNSADFRVIEKVSDKKEDEVLASLGMPSYLSNREITKVTAVGSKMDKDATPASRKAQWETLRSNTASVQEIVAELGYANAYVVIPSQVLNEMKIAFGDISIQAAEAETDTDKAVAYRKAFDIVKRILA